MDKIPLGACVSSGHSGTSLLLGVVTFTRRQQMDQIRCADESSVGADQERHCETSIPLNAVLRPETGQTFCHSVCVCVCVNMCLYKSAEPVGAINLRIAEQSAEGGTCT